MSVELRAFALIAFAAFLLCIVPYFWPVDRKVMPTLLGLFAIAFTIKAFALDAETAIVTTLCIIIPTGWLIIVRRVRNLARANRC
jgi:hypothetical protein